MLEFKQTHYFPRIGRFNLSNHLPANPSEKKHILVFTPEAGVLPHFAAQALLAKTLQEMGHSVLMVRCQSVFTRCPVMDMYNLPHTELQENKKKVCENCLQHSVALEQYYGLKFLDIHDFVTPQMIMEITMIIQQYEEHLQDLVYEGIAFGKMCISALVQSQKILDLENLSEEVSAGWKQYTLSAILSYKIADEICARLPISAIMYHEEYSLLVATRLAGRKHGIPSITTTTSQHLTGDKTLLCLYPDSIWHEANRSLDLWAGWRELALNKTQVKSAMDDVLIRMNSSTASHVYSPAKNTNPIDLHTKLGLLPNKKLLVAFTSSLDERMASKAMIDALHVTMKDFKLPFGDEQIPWIEALIQFAEKRDDIQLIVRIHPREGANKREQVRSQHLELLKNSFANQVFKNCQIIWPEENISSYDLGEIADVVLTTWSTIGLEMARLGVPVLKSTHGVGFWPHEIFMEWADNQSGYFSKLESLLQQTPSLENILYAFRWYNFYYTVWAIDISDINSDKKFNGVLPFKMTKEAPLIESTVFAKSDICENKRLRLQDQQNSDSKINELEALCIQLRRTVHWLMSGEDKENDFTLIWVEVNPNLEINFGELKKYNNLGLHILLSSKNYVDYLYQGQHIHRLSRMGDRLGRLSSQFVFTLEYAGKENLNSLQASDFPYNVELFHTLKKITCSQAEIISKTEKNHPITFIGNLTDANEIAFLEKLASKLPIKFWGKNKNILNNDSAILLKHLGEISEKNKHDIIQQSQIIVVPPGFRFENNEVNAYFLQVLNNGALLITEYHEGLSKSFDIGKEIISYRTVEECIALIQYFIRYPLEREIIAKAGKQKSLALHPQFLQDEKKIEKFSNKVEQSIARLQQLIESGVG